jgi:hypothetical protein
MKNQYILTNAVFKSLPFIDAPYMVHFIGAPSVNAAVRQKHPFDKNVLPQSSIEQKQVVSRFEIG